MLFTILSQVSHLHQDKIRSFCTITKSNHKILSTAPSLQGVHVRVIVGIASRPACPFTYLTFDRRSEGRLGWMSSSDLAVAAIVCSELEGIVGGEVNALKRV
jgi:hypothetical protein